ncbi:5'/3'-nucleotidase SurE [Kiritimatiella glycovorans]|uniref:5'-nucleotidase SurE n=1 Tax=Kiritimatiella glycovorans TaxID=1307763 RepID=A0A0G3EE51_9BACT|nr:5'/3'-nucleotidase SurE [Kiritimatiella glycovorans]AKJ64736.1 5'-nucleotidase SurE [Kiritimatiella glycovorans]
MNILLCNDDGIHAPGLRLLRDTAREYGEVSVVAPEYERSAAGHSITLADPLRTKEIYHGDDFFGWAVSGTPADCVKLAVCALLDEPPDIVLSGVNLGSNTGISVLYSGTVSAATEGVILGIPGIAFSLCTYETPHWETAAGVVRRVLDRFLHNGLRPGSLLNVNIPNLPHGELRGMKPAGMGKSRFVEKFHKRTDPQGNTYYWLDGELEILDRTDDIDIRVVGEGYVALTPIHFDLTDRDWLDHLRDASEHTE